MRIFLITACLITCCLNAAAEQNTRSEVQVEIIGSWLAGETLMPQPPPDMQQDIKETTFQANGLVRWSVVIDGKIQELSGRYAVLTDAQSLRRLPYIIVAPTKFIDPQLSSIRFLLLTDVTIDLDSRFHADRVGKVFKAKSADGKALAFARKKQDSQQE